MDKTLKLQPGKPAPDFTLRDLDGEPVSLSQFKGTVVLLDFWAGWCAPCIGDLVFLRRIEEKTAPRSVVFLKVSLEKEAAWRRAVDEHDIRACTCTPAAGAPMWRWPTTSTTYLRTTSSTRKG